MIVEKWYEQRCVNHRDWILDHLEFLALSVEETVIVLVIDFMNTNGLDISMETLSHKTGMSSEDVDKVVSVLYAKKYLKIGVQGGKVNFDLSGLFETNVAKQEAIIDSSLFDIFETEFNRPLTPIEMQKVSDWHRNLDKTLIIYALREASAYQKVSIAYIEAILKDWQEKGITAQMIEEGKVR